MAFIFGLIFMMFIMNALFWVQNEHLDTLGKIAKQFIVAITISLSLLLSYQLGRIEGHEDVYNYLKNGDELPEGSPFKSLYWNFKELP